jgi:hypothetical protein
MQLTARCPSCRCPVTLTLSTGTTEADAQSLAGRILCVECASTPRPASPPGRVELCPALATLETILRAASDQPGALAGIVGDGSGDLAH